MNCLLILLSISSIASCFSCPYYQLPPALAGGIKYYIIFNGFSQILFNHLAKAQLFFNLQMNGLKPNPIDELPPDIAVHFINCLLILLSKSINCFLILLSILSIASCFSCPSYQLPPALAVHIINCLLL